MFLFYQDTHVELQATPLQRDLTVVHYVSPTRFLTIVTFWVPPNEFGGHTIQALTGFLALGPHPRSEAGYSSGFSPQ